jgi:hypothetical protein
MDPVIRAGTIHERDDRRKAMICFIATPPVAFATATFLYWWL